MGRKSYKNHVKRKPASSVSLTPDKGTYVQRKHKDTLFRFIFRDKKNLLQLYNALNQSVYEDENALEITTLENVIYLGYKNDVSFLLDMKLYLVEHQGSWNPNMPLRGVLYFARLYREYIEQHGFNLYGTGQLPLPSPQYIVFYNGKEPQPERQILRLSDSFQKTDDSTVGESISGQTADAHSLSTIPYALECQVLVLNINYGNNHRFLAQCKPLLDYSKLIHRIRLNLTCGCSPEQAVNSAVEYCLANNILADILSTHRKEVITMFLEDYDEELHHKTIRKEGYEDGYKAGQDAGFDSGFNNGYTEASNRINSLTRQLLADNRQEDLLRSVQDKAFQEILFKEYGL